MTILKAKEVVYDVLVLVGVGVMVYGFWLMYRPVGYILGGLCITAASGLLGYRNNPRPDFRRSN